MKNWIFMFGAVMMENDNCRQSLERVLELPALEGYLSRKLGKEI